MIPRNKTPHHFARARTRLFYPALFYLFLTFPFLSTASNIRSKLCTLASCGRPLVRCIREPECRTMLECLRSCENDKSQGRIESAIKYRHLQFPQNPALCEYECLGLMTTQTSQEIIECIASHGCMPASEYSDECADISQDHVVPFSNIKDMLKGRWKKLYVNGWDIWPCQVTEFHPPFSAEPEPEGWMTAWPDEPDVWRMDLSWRLQPDSTTRFNMSSEIYPYERWPLEQEDGTDPTLKTIARLWETTAYENWYLLHADSAMMMFHICAYTLEVDSYDALTIVYVKEGVDVTNDMATKIREKARDILGDKFGTLLRVRGDCVIE